MKTIIGSLILLAFSPTWAQRATTLGRVTVDPVEFSYRWPAPNQAGFGILWWNTYKGTTNPACAPDEESVFMHNLAEILRSPARPKMIVLGEYELGCLDPWLDQKLEESYVKTVSYYDFPSSTMSFAVYLDRSVKMGRSPSLIRTNWYPSEGGDAYQLEWYEKCRKAGRVEADFAYFQRNVPQFDLTVEGKSLTVVPVHLVMPWKCLTEGSDSFGSKIEVFRGVMAGTDHPVYYQVKSLAENLEKKIERREIDRAVVLGDWNLFSWHKYWTVGRPKTFELLDEIGFSEDTVDDGDRFSFPSLSFNPEKVEQRLLLDHAFHRGSLAVDYAEVLPLQGSDHYPLLLYVSMK